MPYNTGTQAKEMTQTSLTFEEIEESPDCYKYVAVAYNPRKDARMVMSEPRCYADTLEWVRKWCNSFCILPEFSVAV